MGMDFSGRSAAVGMTPEAFLRLVEVAKLYGWQPTATVLITSTSTCVAVERWGSTALSPK